MLHNQSQIVIKTFTEITSFRVVARSVDGPGYSCGSAR